ncbi:type VI secretion system protein TssA [Escherichia coli]|nr:type VI secretion system protein TssA [Escherichia coli]
MSSPESLLTACAASQEERLSLISRANEALSLWDNWLHPFTSGSETGDDPAYDDNFQLMREEINKISGTDSALLCELAQKCLCECARDIRVVTWYVLARLIRDGEKGLSEGLLLLVAMLTRYGQACHPRRPAARKAALEWLNSAKVTDALLLWPGVDSNEAGLTAGAISLLGSAVADWPEAERPSFAGLCSALENHLARSGGMEALVPQNSSTRESGGESAPPDSPQLAAVTSGRDLLDQARLLSRWLNGQPQGWLASHRLMKTVRWDTVDQLPSLDSSGRTRLVPPKTGYRAQLKRLWLQKNWVELIELASQMYCEGVNHFWLDLQWYLWQGLSHAGQPWDSWSDAVLSDLRLLLKRLPGLEGLAWNDGTPFADEVTLAWIAEKVNEEDMMYGDEAAIPAVVNDQTDDVLILESEAMEKGDTEGPEAALAWLQSRPGMDTPRHRWLIRLLMARVAEQYGRNDMALHLLGELITRAPQLTLEDWEPALLFEVRARRLKLLRMKAGRSESDKARLMPEMDTLLAGLIAIDPARAMVLCG